MSMNCLNLPIFAEVYISYDAVLRKKVCCGRRGCGCYTRHLSVLHLTQQSGNISMSYYRTMKSAARIYIYCNS